MAKASKKIDKKVAQVKELSNDLLKDINKKVTSTKKDLQKQVDELTAQVNELREEATKPASKWLKKIEKQYQKQFNKQQKEFEERAEALLETKNKLVGQLEDALSKLPLADKIIPAPKTPAQKAKATVKKATTTAKAKATTAAKKATGAAKSNISQIKGVGPATVKKLNDAGFNSLEDLANASAEKLAQFKSVRGSDTWVAQAKELLK
jgi:predicted flap endonuclease-1-like 5' DNA nuclease